MDRIRKYETIIIKVLSEYVEYWNSNSSIISQLIIDQERKHYQLIRLGWKNDSEYVHYCVFHFDIIDSKVWVQVNRTDILIAEELVKEGIDKQDIVLGMLPPQLRKDSDYAAA